MTYETAVLQEIGSADELTLGAACENACDAEGLPARIDIQF